MRTSTGGRGSGFTLIELMAALSIVGLLAALLLPALASARERARRVVCLSNVRQIGMALTQYVADYDGVFPPAIAANLESGVWVHAPIWQELVTPYGAGPLSLGPCPDRDLDPAFDSFGGQAIFSGYAYNYNLTTLWRPDGAPDDGSGPFARLGLPESRLSAPALAVTVAESRPGVAAMFQADAATPWDPNGNLYAVGYETAIAAEKPGAVRHQGGADYAFADGHAAWLRPEALARGTAGDGVHPSFGL